jgi:hypothetical protein
MLLRIYFRIASHRVRPCRNQTVHPPARHGPGPSRGPGRDRLGQLSGRSREGGHQSQISYARAFVEPGAFVILNLWYQNMRLKKGSILQNLNLRQRATALARSASAGVWKTRALHVDQAIQATGPRHRLRRLRPATLTPRLPGSRGDRWIPPREP